jgi:hypothetical protein
MDLTDIPRHDTERTHPMTTAAFPEHPQHTGDTTPARPGRLPALTVVAAALTAAVVLVPFPLAAALSGGGYRGPEALREAVTTGFVRFWSSGSGALGPDLAAAADFWARFHVVKAVLAAALLGVLLVLVPRLWRAGADAGRPRRWGLRAAATGTASLLVLSLLVLVANVQGALAPLSSVLGVMPLGAPTGDLAATVDRARDAVATASPSPVAATLLDDFTRYHAVMAVLGAVVTVALLAATAVLLRRRSRTARTERPRRRVLVAAAVGMLLLAAFFAVTTAANLGTARHPSAALVGFLGGGA